MSTRKINKLQPLYILIIGMSCNNFAFFFISVVDI